MVPHEVDEEDIPFTVETGCENVEAENTGDDDEEIRLDDRNENDWSDDGSKGRDEHSETVTESVVDSVDILTESIRNSSERSRIEEPHWSAKDTSNRSVVNSARDVVSDPGSGETHSEREDGLHDTEKRVNSLVCEKGRQHQVSRGCREVLTEPWRLVELIVLPPNENVRSDYLGSLLENDWNEEEGERNPSLRKVEDLGVD